MGTWVSLRCLELFPDGEGLHWLRKSVNWWSLLCKGRRDLVPIPEKLLLTCSWRAVGFPDRPIEPWIGHQLPQRDRKYPFFLHRTFLISLRRRASRRRIHPRNANILRNRPALQDLWRRQPMRRLPEAGLQAMLALLARGWPQNEPHKIHADRHECRFEGSLEVGDFEESSWELADAGWRGVWGGWAMICIWNISRIVISYE